MDSVTKTFLVDLQALASHLKDGGDGMSYDLAGMAEKSVSAIKELSQRAYEAECNYDRWKEECLSERARADAYESTLERGELVRVPVRLGAKLFQPYDGEIIEWDVAYIVNGVTGDAVLGCLQADDHDLGEEFIAEVIGTKLYTTREEAEAALEKESTNA
jgi:hypothetical protein